jgi:hypothetical protein
MAAKKVQAGTCTLKIYYAELSPLHNKNFTDVYNLCRHVEELTAFEVILRDI